MANKRIPDFTSQTSIVTGDLIPFWKTIGGKTSYIKLEDFTINLGGYVLKTGDTMTGGLAFTNGHGIDCVSGGLLNLGTGSGTGELAIGRSGATTTIYGGTGSSFLQFNNRYFSIYDGYGNNIYTNSTSILFGGGGIVDATQASHVKVPTPTAISDAVTKAYADGLISALTTTAVPEGTNLYYTDVRADARITAQKAFANGLATLDSGGKIPTSQLPALAITDTFVVASQSAMLALTAETGDVAVRTDINKSYILHGTNPATLGDWQELLAVGMSSVLSVNGYTGAVTLTTSDIAEGTNLYYTQTRFDTDFTAKSTTNLSEGTNLYYTDTRFNTAFTAKSTTDLSEGTNLYFTNARAIAAPLTGYASGSGTISSADTLLGAIQKLNGNDALKVSTGAAGSLLSLALTGTAGAGYLQLLSQSSPPSAVSGNMIVYSNSSNSFSLIKRNAANSADITRTLSFPDSSVTYTYPGASDTLAGLGMAQTFSAKQTFSADIAINSAQTIRDENGNIMLAWSAQTSAQNYLTIGNKSGSNPISITASGPTNVAISLQSKGTGSVTIQQAAGTGSVFLQQNSTNRMQINNTANTLFSPTDAIIGLAIRGNGASSSYTQTGDLLQIQSFDGTTATTRVKVDANGKLTLVASASTGLNGAAAGMASLNIPSGVAPTTPVDGDIWSDGSNIKVRLGGTTYTLTKV